MICPICRKNKVRGRNRVCDSFACREEMRKSWVDERIIVPEDCYTATQAAKITGLTPQGISKGCRAGKYQGAFQDARSGRWYIPKEIIDGKEASI